MNLWNKCKNLQPKKRNSRVLKKWTGWRLHLANFDSRNSDSYDDDELSVIGLWAALVQGFDLITYSWPWRSLWPLNLLDGGRVRSLVWQRLKQQMVRQRAVVFPTIASSLGYTSIYIIEQLILFDARATFMQHLRCAKIRKGTAELRW